MSSKEFYELYHKNNILVLLLLFCPENTQRIGKLFVNKIKYDSNKKCAMLTTPVSSTLMFTDVREEQLFKRNLMRFQMLSKNNKAFYKVIKLTNLEVFKL